MSVHLREAEECAGIIRGFSDVELLKFHHLGGQVPRDMLERLRDVCSREVDIVEREMQRAEKYQPEAELPWVEPPGTVRRKIRHADASRARKIEKARATLALLGAA